MHLWFSFILFITGAIAFSDHNLEKFKRHNLKASPKACLIELSLPQVSEWTENYLGDYTVTRFSDNLLPSPQLMAKIIRL